MLLPGNGAEWCSQSMCSGVRVACVRWKGRWGWGYRDITLGGQKLAAYRHGLGTKATPSPPQQVSSEATTPTYSRQQAHSPVRRDQESLLGCLGSRNRICSPFWGGRGLEQGRELPSSEFAHPASCIPVFFFLCHLTSSLEQKFLRSGTECVLPTVVAEVLAH